jgi:hypothetical protein
MQDKLPDFFKKSPLLPVAEIVRPEVDDGEEETCPAFGFLRGVRDRAVTVEFRLKNGDSEWHSYNCLTSFRFNPSVGILLRFTADVVTLVLIRGSNLDLLLDERLINLTDRGLQRHRITFVREMAEEELKKVGRKQPTIDRIDIAEFEDQESLKKWLEKIAPVFVRQ